VSELVPRERLAWFTRGYVEDHEDWDGEHEFLMLVWEGGEVRVRTAVIIPQDVPADVYPQIMHGIVAQELKTRRDAPVAYLLRFEGYMAELVGASKEEVAAFDADDRPIRDRPGSFEVCTAICVDVHGRQWYAMKRREGGGITEAYFPPGRRDVVPGGRFGKALESVAYATGMSHYGLPGPPWMAN